MSRVSQVDDRWRRRPQYVAEECYSFYRGQKTRAIRFNIVGPHQKEDGERLLKGLVCSNCMEPFPAKPGPDTLQLFIDANAFYPQENWHDLVRQSRCPMCGDEVSYEYANLLFEGTLPTPNWND
jgi:hypothetical protein